MIETAKQKDAVRPLFDGASWVDGQKLVKCGNEEAVKFVTVAIESWPTDSDTRLMVIPEADLSKMLPPKAWLWAPCPVIPSKELVSLIVFQNEKAVKAERWKIIKCGPLKPHGQHFLIQLDVESLPALERSKADI